MKYGARIASSACLATTIVFSLSVLFYSTTRDVTPVHAEKEFITGSVSSSPTSGPVGAMISISGSGWPDPDGEQVSFGYMIGSYCSIVPEAQTGTFNSGSFSGSLQLPNGTPLGTYQICATFGSTTANANTYTVLTESSPQVSISFSTQKGKQKATISGSNFLPAGTTVNLFWETTNGNVIFTITSAISDSNGLISRTFTVPTTIASGSYKIVANVGGQQPTLSASAAFTYKVPTPPPPPPTPTPPPTPLPTPDPSPTQHLTPTTVATAVATAIPTPTIGATALVGSQNTNTGQTPSSPIASNDPNTNQSTSMVLIGSITGGLALLATTLIIGLFIRRKKARSIEITTAVQPTQSSPMSWQNNQLGGTLHPITKGSIAVSQPWPVSSTPPSQQQLQISPYTHLLQQPERGNSALTSEPLRLTPDDPNIETIKRQVQMGLFATSGNRRND
jgi:hypothetical protein